MIKNKKLLLGTLVIDIVAFVSTGSSALRRMTVLNCIALVLFGLSIIICCLSIWKNKNFNNLK